MITRLNLQHGPKGITISTTHHTHAGALAQFTHNCYQAVRHAV